ncbi:MAG: hypothetical protein RPS47_16540 [Colwellia sp.]|jgi:hypothetical protein
MNIALISDDFTRTCLQLEPNVKITNVTPLNWRYRFMVKKPDVLIVESAWLGFKNSWKKKIASYGNEQINKQLQTLLKYCRNNNVATVFWNKEDPVNYQRFKHNLAEFDVCLTTEQEMLGKYKKEFKNLKSVQLMPFFFQPKLHNLQVDTVIEGLNSKIIFCGGLYKAEFPDRAQRLNNAVRALGKNNVVVYDRFERGAAAWEIEDSESAFNDFEIRKPFAYQDSKTYYQSGMAHLNVNSLDGSTTMFSRRMLELIACGAHVLDVTAHKGKGLLSPFVTQVTTSQEVVTALNCEPPKIEFDYLTQNYSVNSFVKKIENII